MAMATLMLLQYNNYYNRTIKGPLITYGQYSQYTVKYNNSEYDSNGNRSVITNINFNPEDDIETEHVVNWAGDVPNYVVVITDPAGIAINSRWFVIYHKRSRSGQLILGLRRDVVADYYNSVINAETFIEKATISNPETNNLIFNNEDMSFNQIKQSEYLIKDQSQCPWIVAYCASKNADGTVKEYEANISQRSIPSAHEFTEAEWNDITSYGYSSPFVGFTNAPTFRMWGRVPGEYYDGTSDLQWYRLTTVNAVTEIAKVTNDSVKGQFTNKSTMMQCSNKMNQIYPTLWHTYTDNYVGVNTTMENIRTQYQNQTVSVRLNNGTIKYYTLKFYSKATQSKTIYLSAYAQTPPIDNILQYVRNNLEQYYSSWLATGASIVSRVPTISVTYETYWVTASEITDTTVTNKITIQADRYHLVDAPYDMFCMPYSDDLQVKTNTGTLSASRALAFDALSSLALKYAGASGGIYDVQILPYCPVVNSTITTVNGKLTIDVSTLGNKAYSIITNSATSAGSAYILHCTQSSFIRQVSLPNPVVIQDYKVESQCDMYRLCSPNYNGVFEFNAAKNGGLTTLNLVCTYKPYDPYIKVFPTFGRLYGNVPENGDARGLICGGDFSLPIVTSAWEEYQLQNKNFQASFDRQIQNMEINNSIQREKEMWQGIAGIVGGGVGGAVAGAKVGGAAGAYVGGLVGTLAGTTGYIVDRNLNQKARQEAIDYTRDQFGYALGNIQALPQALSKSSAIVADNKFFPFLEYYTCSELEKQALRDKIKYNGMTVMVVGKITDYLQGEPTYIKGKIIRLTNNTVDAKIVSAIAEEINKGVFI